MTISIKMSIFGDEKINKIIDSFGKPEWVVPCQDCDLGAEHYCCSKSSCKQKITELEARLASKCEMHVDYGSDIEALIEEMKSDVQRLEKENARLRGALECIAGKVCVDEECPKVHFKARCSAIAKEALSKGTESNG